MHDDARPDAAATRCRMRRNRAILRPFSTTIAFHAWPDFFERFFRLAADEDGQVVLVGQDVRMRDNGGEVGLVERLLHVAQPLADGDDALAGVVARAP